MLSDGSKRFLGIVNNTNVINGTKTLRLMKSLILAQNERWWRVLYMQVERGSNAQRRTGE